MMNEKMKGYPTEGNPTIDAEELSDEMLEEAAGGARGRPKSFASLYGARCTICGKLGCKEHSLANERAPWG